MGAGVQGISLRLETNTLKPNNLCKFQNNVAQYIVLRFLNIYCFTAFNKKKHYEKYRVIW